MAAYGDDETIAQMLGPGDAVAGFSDALGDRISAMNEVVSALVEDATGRAWITTAPVAATKRVYPVGGSSSILVLPVPAVSISAITVDQNDEGSVLSGGTVLDATAWAVAYRNDRDEITALRMSPSGYWVGYAVLTITGIWADTVQTVPADIAWAVNYIAAERLKQEQASPAGFLGPDGTVTPIRNPWNDPQVKAVLQRHTLTGKRLVM